MVREINNHYNWIKAVKSNGEKSLAA